MLKLQGFAGFGYQVQGFRGLGFKVQEFRVRGLLNPRKDPSSHREGLRKVQATSGNGRIAGRILYAVCQAQVQVRGSREEYIGERLWQVRDPNPYVPNPKQSVWET